MLDQAGALQGAQGAFRCTAKHLVATSCIVPRKPHMSEHSLAAVASGPAPARPAGAIALTVDAWETPSRDITKHSLATGPPGIAPARPARRGCQRG